MKVIRHDDTHHDVCEIEADVLLEGDLDGSYLSNDNSSIVPTDTVKNTVNFLAHDHLGTCRTRFAHVIGDHFLKKYEHLSAVTIELRERRWERMKIAGKEHPHSFAHAANGQTFSRGKFLRDHTPILSSGIRDYLVLKTTQSSFTDYNVCDLTTLPPADDRVFSTRLTAEWTFIDPTTDFAAADATILAAAEEIFATTHSPSVQRTLYQIGQLALEKVPEISKIEIKMPNVHFLPLDLTKLGRPGQTTLLLPTDEPAGQIEAVITR